MSYTANSNTHRNTELHKNATATQRENPQREEEASWDRLLITVIPCALAEASNPTGFFFAWGHSGLPL